jgi:hypothetical protein
MIKNILIFLLAISLTLSAGCSASEENAAVLPEQPAASDDLSGTTDESAEDSSETNTTVKAAADEPVAAAQADFYYWGYVNTKGEWVIEPQYTEAYPFVDNVATVKTETEWQLINKSNEVIAKFDSDIEVIEPMHPTTYPVPGEKASGCTIFDGMIVIARDVNGDGVIMSDDLYGYADVTGKIIVDPQYKNANAFHEGLAAVDLSESPNLTDYNWGYIDKTGNTVIAPAFSWAGDFSEGVARVQSNGEYKHKGVIDTTGQWLFSTESMAVYPNGDFKDGFAPARIGHEFGLVDKNGNTLKTVPGSDDPHMATDYSPIGADAFQEGLYPLFDITIPNPEDGFFAQGFIDSNGNFAVPAQTEWKAAQGFSDGLCCVFTGESYNSMDHKYGYIDKTGEVVIPIQYSNANMFNFGYAIVAVGDQFSASFMIIDKTGGTVAELPNVTDALTFTK